MMENKQGGFGLGWTKYDWLGELTSNITFSIPGGGSWCDQWREPQNVLYHVANACFALAYVAPTNSNGELFMQAALIVGFILVSAWSWNSICAPDAFSWNFGFAMLNMLQLFHAVYRLRPVKFDPELEEVYRNLFQPFKVTRLQFKKLVSAEFAQILSLHAGEAYAMQNLTRTDRLGLLLSGKVNVMSDHQFLHPILPCEFLDSPEFESSRANVDDKFKVSIIAATSCRYLFWQRTALEYLFVKETYLATVVSTIVARDITTKLYSMNSKIVTEKGSHLDIRLPALTSSLGHRATPRLLRHHRAGRQTHPSPPSHGTDLHGSRERLVVGSPGKEDAVKHHHLPNGRLRDPERAERPEPGEPQRVQHSKQSARGAAQRGEPQQGEPQQGEPQQGEPQRGEPQQGEPQRGEPQQGAPQQGEPQEGEPQEGAASPDDLTEGGVESWLESSSKYHSCELVDE